MKKALKFALVALCVSLFFGNSFCLAQSDSQVINNVPLNNSVTGPTSDFDKMPAPSGSFLVPADHWRERSSGYYLEFFDVNAGTILGWTIIPSSNRGYDKWGTVDSSFTAHWATQGSDRWAYSGEVAYMSPYPFSTYTFVNSWGANGSGTMATPASYYNGSLYESFFDGTMAGPGGLGYTDDGNGTWAMVFASDPGNYIDNRVYEVAGDGTVDWRGTVYGYGYATSYGFSFNADCRRTDGNTTSYGIQFYSDDAVGPGNTCYGFWIGPSSFSVWKNLAGSASALISWTTSTAINPVGEWNNLRVEELNGNMEFFINDVSVGTAYDTDITSGWNGVAGYDGTGSGNLQWDNLTIHRQPSVVLGPNGGSSEPLDNVLPQSSGGL